MVSPRLILSSYHCTFQMHPTHCDSGNKRLAVLGRHEFNKWDIKSYYTIPITGVRYPPHQGLTDYQGNTNYLSTHDFAMLILNEPVKFSPTVRPICLPLPDEDFSGESAVAAGWGRTDKQSINKKQSRYLKRVRLLVSDMKYKHTKMFGTELFKKKEVYQDPCSGDSGTIWIFLGT